VSQRAVFDAPGSPLSVARGDEGARGLVDQPINPDWVLSGNPRARIRLWATSADKTTSNWVWDCTAGRFRWHHELDETIFIVEGGARISVGVGAPRELGPGDSAYIPAGSWTDWTVAEYVRKYAVVRVPVPPSLRYVVKGFGARLHRRR
jgi:uncharacterized cupin superfamily protein